MDSNNYILFTFVDGLQLISNYRRINFEDINDELPPARVKRNIDWKIKHFEFSNMFCNGENNVVDFTQLDGIVGMFAPNASGKSTLLDALSSSC